MLKLSPANAKTKKVKGFAKGRKVYSLDLLSGHTCPYAKDCKSMAVSIGSKRKVQDGPNCRIRCFSASQEAQYSNVFNARKHNSDLLRGAKTKARIKSLISASLPQDIGILRYHVGGDFFSVAYLEAAIEVATENSNILFYAYTKNLPALVRLQHRIPKNFRIVASYGGTHDHMVPLYKGVSCSIVTSKYQAKKAKLPLDTDDSHAIMQERDFAILVHGIQPAGTKASKSVARQRKIKQYGHTR